ncbi:hypothetical protein [Pelagibius sp.]|uniref:hypothetical protein n=1 Tax=Pelagibius sp. TaxID=1931238 RepID=UPI003B50A3BE
MAFRHLLAAVGFILSAASAPAYAANAPLVEEELRRVFEDLRAGTLTPAEASAKCFVAMIEGDDAHSMREVLSTFLEVSEPTALPVFCNTLVAATEQGVLEPGDLDPIIDPRDEQAESYAIGRLLRVVYFLHNGLPTAPLSEGRTP